MVLRSQFPQHQALCSRRQTQCPTCKLVFSISTISTAANTPANQHPVAAAPGAVSTAPWHPCDAVAGLLQPKVARITALRARLIALQTRATRAQRNEAEAEDPDPDPDPRRLLPAGHVKHDSATPPQPAQTPQPPRPQPRQQSQLPRHSKFPITVVLTPVPTPPAQPWAPVLTPVPTPPAQPRAPVLFASISEAARFLGITRVTVKKKASTGAHVRRISNGADATTRYQLRHATESEGRLAKKGQPVRLKMPNQHEHPRIHDSSIADAASAPAPGTGAGPATKTGTGTAVAGTGTSGDPRWHGSSAAASWGGSSGGSSGGGSSGATGSTGFGKGEQASSGGVTGGTQGGTGTASTVLHTGSVTSVPFVAWAEHEDRSCVEYLRREAGPDPAKAIPKVAFFRDMHHELQRTQQLAPDKTVNSLVIRFRSHHRSMLLKAAAP